MDIKISTEYTLIFEGLDIRDNIGLFVGSLIGIAVYCCLVQFVSWYKFRQAFDQPRKSTKLIVFGADIINSILLMYLLMTLNAFVICVVVLTQLIANLLLGAIFRFEQKKKDEDFEIVNQ